LWSGAEEFICCQGDKAARGKTLRYSASPRRQHAPAELRDPIAEPGRAVESAIRDVEQAGGKVVKVEPIVE